MTKYLISFTSAAMVLPDEELQAVSDASHAVVEEAKDAGVWVFGGGIDESIRRSWSLATGPSRGHVHADQASRRRLHGARVAVPRGGSGMGCKDRGCVPMRAGGARVTVRPRQLTAREPPVRAAFDQIRSTHSYCGLALSVLDRGMAGVGSPEGFPGRAPASRFGDFQINAAALPVSVISAKVH